MKKSTKITLWVVGSLVAVIAIAMGSIDAWLSHVAKKEIQKALIAMPDVDASVGKIHVLLLSGSAVVEDVHFATCALANLPDSVEAPLQPGFRLDVPVLSVGPVNYLKLLRQHELRVLNVSVEKPRMTFYFDDRHPERSFPVFPKDTSAAKAGQWLSSILVKNLHLHRVNACIRSTRTALDVQVDSLTISADDLGYCLTDSSFAYNDSCYEFRVGGVRVNLPDNSGRLEAHHIRTSDQGPLKLGYTRFCNTKSVFAMADKVKHPVAWIDIELNSVKTAPFNPIRKVLAQDYSLASLSADVRRLHVKRDNRYDFTSPVPTPQEALRKLPVVFDIRQVEAQVRNIDIDMYLQKENPGKLHLENIHASLADITNRKNAVWKCKAHAPVGKQGIADILFRLHMDRDSHFDLSLDGSNIEASFLNPFIRPLVGLSLECPIDRLETAYSGDGKKAKGTFCLLYHGLTIQAHKEEKVPFSVVTKHANTITNVANSLLTKSNPSSVDVKPRRYNVEWERDVMKDYPVYLFGPIIIGTVQTMLPGLYVHKQI